MKEYSIFFSEFARTDLGNIYTFVENISSEQNAKLVIGRIAQKIYSLNFSPQRTEPFAYSKDNSPLYCIIAGRYRIIYLIDNTSTKVVIVRIFSVSQNVTSKSI